MFLGDVVPDSVSSFFGGGDKKEQPSAPPLKEYEGEKEAAAEREKARNEDNPEYFEKMGFFPELFAHLGEGREAAQKAIEAWTRPAHGAEAVERAMPLGGKIFGNVLGGLGLVSNGFGLAKGISKLGDKEKREEGVGDILQSGSGLLSTGAGMVAPHLADADAAGFLGTFGNVAGMFGGGVKAAQAYSDHKKNGWTGENVTDMIGGGLDAAGALASQVGGPAGTTAAAVLKSGSFGLSVGKEAYGVTEETSRGYFGKNAAGKQRTASDAAVDWGLSADEGTANFLTKHLGMNAGTAESVGNVAGSATAMLGGIGNVIANPLLHLFSHYQD